MGSQPPPGDLLDRGFEPTSTELQVDSLPYVSPGKPVSYVSCNNPFLAGDYSVGSGWAHCYLVFIVFSPFSGKSWKTHIYSQPSVSVGFSCIQPTADEKYSEKNSRKFQKTKLEFAAQWQLFT